MRNIAKRVYCVKILIRYIDGCVNKITRLPNNVNGLFIHFTGNGARKENALRPKSPSRLKILFKYMKTLS